MGKSLSEAISNINSNTGTKYQLYGANLELFANDNSATPYIDFHYGGSTSDFTSRISEPETGVLLAENLFKGRTVTNANDADAGISCISNISTNAPFSNFWATLFTIEPKNTSYKQQFAMPWGSGESHMLKYRVYDSGSWGSWHSTFPTITSTSDTYTQTNSAYTSWLSGTYRIMTTIDALTNASALRTEHDGKCIPVSIYAVKTSDTSYYYPIGIDTVGSGKIRGLCELNSQMTITIQWLYWD